MKQTYFGMHGERRRGDASCKRTVKLIQNCQAFYTAKENCGKSPEELNLHQSQSHLPRAKEDLTAKEKRKQRIARSAIYVSQKKKGKLISTGFMFEPYRASYTF